MGGGFLACLFIVLAAWARAQSPATVLVVANAANPRSSSLAHYYMLKRSIPASNLLLLNWTATDSADTISLADYTSKIAAPVYAKIATLSQIDYIVLCRNLPSKISDTSGSVDSALAGNSTTAISNPYYGKSNAAFSSATYGVYLVTRLDGWSWPEAYALVTRSLTAKTGAPILFDEDPTKTGQYAVSNVLMGNAYNYLTTLNIPATLVTTFTAPAWNLGGYYSWGSNDANFNAKVFAGLRFAPGALAETLVSTSGSNIRFPGGSQSQISQLVRDGVTGVKGYVSEPYLTATANPYLLFVNYVSGRNLAESFYSASRYMGWKDVVLGDPLCAPYR